MSFDQTNVAGDTLVYSSIHSPNYAQGSSGWTINKDGSAEFQNVLVRGTITASNIIGSTITGGTITGGDFQSANFSNASMTGFDLNGNATPDTAGTPGNTIQVYSNFVVGPPAGEHIQIGYGTSPLSGSANTAFIEFPTGLAAETIPAFVLSEPNPAAATEPAFYISSANAGAGQIQMEFTPQYSTTPAAINIVANNSPSIVPEFIVDAGVQTYLEQPNTVLNGLNALTVGGAITANNMRLSSNEIWAVNSSAVGGTLYLGEDSTESSPGSLANKFMRTQYVRDITSHAGLNSLEPTFAVIGTTSIVTFFLPHSGIVTVWYKVDVTSPAVIAQTFYADVIIKNVTQSTTPYAGSVFNSSKWTTSTAVAADGTPMSIVGFTTFGAGGQGGVLGNTGDTMTVQNAYAVSAAANTWTATECQLTVIPSF
jgi:hypothetical protein